MNDIAVKDLVLIGGGHAHVHVLKMFGMHPVKGARITLITRDIESPYSGMIPGFVSGMYTREECHIDLGKLSSFASVRLFHTEVTRIDTANRLIYCLDGRPPVAYDLLSINSGIVPRPMAKIKANYVTAVKPIDGFAARWESILDRTRQLSAGQRMSIAVVGGGGGGVELCFSIQYRLSRPEFASKGIKISVFLLNRGSKIMSGHSEAVRAIIMRLLEEKGVVVYNNADIVDARSISLSSLSSDSRAEDKELVAADGRTFAYDEAMWCTQASTQPWISESGLDVTQDGFIKVQPTLQSTNFENVFAVGDVCHNVKYPRPKAGVFAVRAGPPLHANLHRLLTGSEPLEEWVPQSVFLGIIGIGIGYAVASKGGMGIEGEFLWDLKDKIDRDFMAKYSSNLPEMDSESEEAVAAASLRPSVTMGEEVINMLSHSKMRCGGCGSKVGAQVLSRVLDRVRKYLYTGREEVISGIAVPGSSDDAAIVRPPAASSYLVHSIDYFRSFISDPFVFGKIAANHALSDVFAMNGDPVSALALCVVPYGPEDKVEDLLVQYMAGLLIQLEAEKCALVGGHTSEGMEASLGLSVTGVVNPDCVLRKGPPELGHVVMLTKGLGTGTVLAADMRAKAKGPWVSAAIKSMVQSNSGAAKILHKYGCSACTDVTGFGFMGHLIEMLQCAPTDEETSLVGAMIHVDNVPLLDGAAECVKAGVFSSLHPQNIRCSRAVDNIEAVASHPGYPLLYDPQTSGGLLAAVPREHASAALQALREAGYSAAAAVGTVTPRDKSDEFAAHVTMTSDILEL